MTTHLQNFREFLKRREAASTDFERGDAGLLSGMVARISPSSFFPPQGGYRKGPNEVAAAYRRIAARTHPLRVSSSFEVFQMAADGCVAYWTGLQHTTVQLHSTDQPLPFDLRVTEVFQLENDEWKLVHRHADELAAEPARNSRDPEPS